jgi:NodT family efflux transporter outer membrane factor (OMF) lipoprotein
MTPRLALAALAAALLPACSLAPAVQAPRTVAQMPAAFDQADTLTTYAPQRWWAGFESPVLDRLVDSTLAGNLDLAEAVARVDQAVASARVARSALFPSLSATGSGSYQTQSAGSNVFGGAAGGGGAPGGGGGDGGGGDPNGGGGDGGGGDPNGGAGGGQEPQAPDRFAFEQYSVGLGLAYELDFWGRVRNDTRAAYADAAAAAADLQTARLTVAAQTISTFFEVVDLRQRIAITLDQIDLLAERADLTEQRYARGLVGSFELYSILQTLRTTQAGLPSLEADLTDAESRLALLAGRYAGDLDDLLPLRLDPVLPLEPVPPGLPSDLLLQRPDVRAAAYRFEAARFRIGARRAELLPSLALSANLGLQALEPQGLVDLENWSASLAGNLTAPLFQGGRLRANVSAAEAVYAQQAAAYARTVLTAYREVHAALERHQEERQRFRFLLEQLAEAERQQQVQARRFARGIGEYTAVLDAERNVLTVRTSLATAGRAAALARLGVYRALGGGWTDGAPAPTVDLVDADLVYPDADELPPSEVDLD